MAYVHRDLEPRLAALMKQFPAVAVTGPRQCGKSTLLKARCAATHRYVTFDDPLAREQALADPKLFLETVGDKVVLDEIQYVPELLSYVKMAIDANRHRPGRFVVTGSQQFAMIKNLGDSLAGRIALLELLPFHVEEKRRVARLKRAVASPLGAFLHACLVGSYPEVCLQPRIDRLAWYGAYVRTYLERDIRTIYNIGDLREFQRFLQLLASRTAQILHLTSLSSELGVGVNTIKRWLSILEASRIVYLLQPYYRHFGKRITKAPKVYFLDCGLVCYLTGIRDRAQLLDGPMAGALFETYCLQETVKVLFCHDAPSRLYYLRSHNGLEVDLLIERNAQLFPYEIKLTKTPRWAMADSIRRFKALFPALPVRAGGILCLAEERAFLGKDLTIQPLADYWRWLRENR